MANKNNKLYPDLDIQENGLVTQTPDSSEKNYSDLSISNVSQSPGVFKKLVDATKNLPSSLEQGILNVGGATQQGLERLVSGGENLIPQALGSSFRVTPPRSPFYQPNALVSRVVEPSVQYGIPGLGMESAVSKLGPLAFRSAESVAPRVANLLSAPARYATIGAGAGALGTPGTFEQRATAAAYGVPLGLAGAAVGSVASKAIKGITSIPDLMRSLKFHQNFNDLMGNLLGNETPSSIEPSIARDINSVGNRIKQIGQDKYNNLKQLINNSSFGKAQPEELPTPTKDENGLQDNSIYVPSKSAASYGGMITSPNTVALQGRNYLKVPISKLTPDDMQSKGGIPAIQSLPGLQHLIQNPISDETTALAKQFLNNPTYPNAHNLQSSLGKHGTDAVQSLMMPERELGGVALDTRDKLKSDMSNALMQHDPQLANEVERVSDYYRDHVVPYNTAYFKNILDPEKYGKTPSALINKLRSDDPRVLPILQHLRQFSPKTNDKILGGSIMQPKSAVQVTPKGVQVREGATKGVMENINQIMQNLTKTSSDNLQNNLRTIISPERGAQLKYMQDLYGSGVTPDIIPKTKRYLKNIAKATGIGVLGLGGAHLGLKQLGE